MKKTEFIESHRGTQLYFDEISKLWAYWYSEDKSILIVTPVTSKHRIVNNGFIVLGNCLGYDYNPKEISLYVNRIELEDK